MRAVVIVFGVLTGMAGGVMVGLATRPHWLGVIGLVTALIGCSVATHSGIRR